MIWFLISGGLPLFLLNFYNFAFVPAKMGVVLLCVNMIVWVTMLGDSYRPIARLHWWGWAFLILLSLGFSEVFSRFSHGLFEAYRVPTFAMEPMISRGDQLLISRSAYWFREPQRGDLIVFNTSGIKSIVPAQPEKNVMVVKRIVGLPNDIVEIGGGNIFVNNIKMAFGDPGHPIQYRNVQTGILPRGVESYAVPAGEYFVLGDNSEHSYDSRYWGTIRRSAIHGKVTKIYWPWSRMSVPR